MKKVLRLFQYIHCYFFHVCCSMSWQDRFFFKAKSRWMCIQCIDFTNTCIRFQKQHYPITSTAWPAELQSRHLFHMLITYSRLRVGVGVAQLVEHLTEKPGTILTQFWVPGAARVFLPRATSSANSLTVSVTPCAQSHATTSVCMLKIPNTGMQPYHCLDTRK